MRIEGIPQVELSEALAKQINGRAVRVAVFTTFSFDPGFFELNILPTLFYRSFSQNERVRRCELEDAMRSVDDIVVYYDRSALAQEAQSPQLGFQRIDVRRKAGVFHPKLILLLLDDPIDEEKGSDDSQVAKSESSLIVGILSANLTRSGWWENVEVGHFEEIKSEKNSGKSYPFRKDLLGLIQQIKRCATNEEKHSALDKVHDFLVHEVAADAPVNATARSVLYTRIFYGQSPLSEWLKKEVKVSKYSWHLEIISPYFDKTDIKTLQKLLESVPPDETRIFLPKNFDGTAAVSPEFYKAVKEMKNVKWSELPSALVRRGKTAEKTVSDRFVHAKLYRFWQPGCSVLLIGSVNLTSAAHSIYKVGNIEAAFLWDSASDTSSSRINVDNWWMQPVETKPQFGEIQDDDGETLTPICIDISLRHDWERGKTFYRLDAVPKEVIKIQDPSGQMLFLLKTPIVGRWTDCGEDATKLISKALLSSAVFTVKTGNAEWRILVREDGTSQRPSFESLLTPEEILRCWAATLPEQKQVLLDAKLAIQDNITQPEQQDPAGACMEDVTIFDRFAGIYHAFERFLKDTIKAVNQGRIRDAETKLFGEKFDSLPVFLRKVGENKDEDAIMTYVKFLCAKQVREEVMRSCRAFCDDHKTGIAKLDGLLSHLDELRNAIPLPEGQDRGVFTKWYEKKFLSRRTSSE